MKLFKSFSAFTLTVASVLTLMFTTGCTDESIASSNNIKSAINRELAKQSVWIALVGSSAREGSNKPPFVILDPRAKINEQMVVKKHRMAYLNSIINYAFTLQNSGALRLENGYFDIHNPFNGTIHSYGFVVQYNQELTGSLSVLPYYGLVQAKIASLEVRDFIKTTSPQKKNGVEYVDITFTVQMNDLASCINQDVLRESFALEEVGNAVTTYRVFFNKDTQRWEVLEPKHVIIDPVGRYYRKLIGN
jgi:hypothetical protein